MSPTMCKIPLGVFYGHMVVLPGEDYAELDNTSVFDNTFDSTVQATINTQCNILSALAEDVQCRYLILYFIFLVYITVIIYTYSYFQI